MLSIPDEVYLRLKMHREIRWSEVIRRAIIEFVEKLEKGNSEMTTNLLKELGDDFRKSLNELSFEKAAKGYEMMKDAEWKRIYTT